MIDIGKQQDRQRLAYENRWRFSDEDMPEFADLSPEEQAATCERCGASIDPETPFAYGDPILCGVDVCKEADENVT